MNPETALATLAPLIGMIARERTRTTPHLYDDARQEGLIAVWRVAADRPDASRAYLVACARNAITGVVTRDTMTGKPSHRGREDAHTTAVGYRFDPDDDPARTGWLTDVGAAQALAAAEMAAHTRQVHDAVTALDPDDTDLVVLRFWRGQTFPEIARDRARGTEVYRRRWVEHIRPRLRAQLRHLASAV